MPFKYPKAGRRAPRYVQAAIAQFRRLPLQVRASTPLLYWLLGEGTPGYKMTGPESDYRPRSPVRGQICGNCEFAYQQAVDRLTPVLNRCAEMMQLEAGWDSYGARAPRMALFQTGLELLARLVGDGALVPHVVPTTRGGLQLEWSVDGRELEIEVLGTNRFDVIYEDENTGDSYDGEVVGDLGPLLAQVAKLTAAP